MTPLCAHCRTARSPLWRRGLRSEVLCNACGLYWRNHGRYRPLGPGALPDDCAGRPDGPADGTRSAPAALPGAESGACGPPEESSRGSKRARRRRTPGGTFAPARAGPARLGALLVDAHTGAWRGPPVVVPALPPSVATLNVRLVPMDVFDAECVRAGARGAADESSADARADANFQIGNDSHEPDASVRVKQEDDGAAPGVGEGLAGGEPASVKETRVQTRHSRRKAAAAAGLPVQSEEKQEEDAQTVNAEPCDETTSVKYTMLPCGKMLLAGDHVAVRGCDGDVYFAVVRDFWRDAHGVRRVELTWLLPRPGCIAAIDGPAHGLSPGLFVLGRPHGQPEMLDAAVVDVFFSPLAHRQPLGRRAASLEPYDPASPGDAYPASPAALAAAIREGTVTLGSERRRTTLPDDEAAAALSDTEADAHVRGRPIRSLYPAGTRGGPATPCGVPPRKKADVRCPPAPALCHDASSIVEDVEIAHALCALT